MPKLYVLRHGQTVYNLQKRVQGHCDSPLTELGVEQARAAGRWIASERIRFDRMCSSPLGRTLATLDVVREELTAAGMTDLPPVEPVDGLIERCYGEFEGGLQSDVPADLWDPARCSSRTAGRGASRFVSASSPR